MNNKKYFLGVFSLGIVIGAFASDKLSNGLFEFKAGDPIIAQEVNSNFALLQERYNELKTEIITTKVLRPWYCQNSSGAAGYLKFNRNGQLEISSGTVFNNDFTTWSIGSGEGWVVNLDGLVDTTASIEHSDNFGIRIVPENTSYEPIVCEEY